MIDKEQEIQLLNLVRDLEQAESKFRAVIAKSFNIFAAAGLIRQEIRHSKILAFLLNPNEPHGLGDNFLKKLIVNASNEATHETRPSTLKIALGNFDDAIVRTEENRIDILIRSPSNKLVIVIENKVDSGEGENQLFKYRERVAKDPRFQDYKQLFIYLTLTREEPSDVDWWVPMDYDQIRNSLDDLLKSNQSTLSNDSNLFITHYRNLIGRHILEDEKDQDYVDALLAIYGKHKQLIDDLTKELPKQEINQADAFLTQNDSVVKLYRSKLKLAFLTKDLMDMIPETDGTAWYSVKKPIIFWFEFADDKIRLNLEVGPMADQDLRVEIINNLLESIGKKIKPAYSEKYTRVWSEKEDMDELKAEKVVELMNRLFKKAQDDNVFDSVKEVATKIWRNNK